MRYFWGARHLGEEHYFATGECYENEFHSIISRAALNKAKTGKRTFVDFRGAVFTFEAGADIDGKPQTRLLTEEASSMADPAACMLAGGG